MPYNSIPNPEMVTKSTGVRQVLTADLYAYLISLIPTPDSYGELHDRFETCFAGSLKGDPEMIKKCEEARSALNVALAIISGVGKAVSPKDPTVQDKFKEIIHVAEKNVAASTTLGVPKDCRVNFDKKGKPYCQLTKMPGASGYEIWFCEGEPSVESNWKLLAWSTTCQRIALQGLNRTKTNYLKIRGKRGNTLGPWSNIMSLEPA